jgi:hypothetical protein
VITVSSMMPPRSLRNTDKVDVYGARVESDDGVNHSRNCVAVAPRKLDNGCVGEKQGQLPTLTWTVPYVQHQRAPRSVAHADGWQL